MGNRAVIAFVGSTDKSKCIYLHWNGGRASVEAFLKAARYLRLRHKDGIADGDRAMQQLGTLIARHFFGHDTGMTVYVEDFGRADKDNWDNGLYTISEDYHIVGRRYTRGPEEVNPDKSKAIFEQIVERAPIFND